MAQLTVGPSSIASGNQFTGYYYDLNLGVFVKLITRPFSYIAHKTLQVSTISFYNILCNAFFSWV